MLYSIIQDNSVYNIIIADQDYGESIGALNVDGIGVAIGDSYDGMFFRRVLEDGTILNINAGQIREQAYATMRNRKDESALIYWEGKTLTVDEANKIYMDYIAEGSDKASKIQTLIASAKAYIRELYPDISVD